MPYHLTVTLLNGKDLLASDFLAKSDPYVIFTLGKATYKSKFIAQDLNPIWNEKFTLEFDSLNDVLKVNVMDYDTIGGDDPLGETVVKIDGLNTKKQTNVEVKLPTQGFINMVLVAEDFGTTAAPLKVPRGLFYIRATMNNYYLDAKDASKSEGTQIITWTYNGNDNQVWNFKDDGSITNALSNLYLAPNKKGSCVLSKTPAVWSFDGENMICEGKVMDVKGENSGKGASVIVWDKNMQPNQKFELVHAEIIP